MTDSSLVSSQIQMQNGVFKYKGVSQFLSTTDYPYYRDTPDHWADRLEKLKSLGHQIITCYIPWRHHELQVGSERVFDFTGSTQPNRDVIGFLRLCQEKGLLVLAKPGPFIHAEINYGGLPDYVCPLFRSEIEPMLDHTGLAFPWPGNRLAENKKEMRPWPLPAPLNPAFLAEVKAWFSFVSSQVIAPFTDPHGPIVMLQVANEGIYSNHQRPVWAYDYSSSSLALYREFLQQRYSSLKEYNGRHVTQFDTWEEIQPPRSWKEPLKLPDTLAYADWSAYQSYYMGRVYSVLKSYLPQDLPFVINVNPPVPESYGVDTWLSRINPDEWPELNYGFTNWIGVACDDRSVVDRYQVMVKRSRGPNLEENWGFSKLYNAAFTYESVSFYQTLLAIASGGSGYNVYTGAATAHFDPELDQLNLEGYPEAAPINAGGEITPKGQVVARLNQFFNRSGAEFLETRPASQISWGLYLPYAHLAAWQVDGENSVSKLPRCGAAFMRFQRQMLDAHLDFGLVNLQAVTGEELQKIPFLILETGNWMDRATQEKLAAYAGSGGRLILVGKAPEMDEDFQLCACLANENLPVTWLSVERLDSFGLVDELVKAGLPVWIQAKNEAAREAFIWVYAHPDRDVQYLFILSGKNAPGEIEFSFAREGNCRDIHLRLPHSSGAILRLEGGRLARAYLRGANDYLNEQVAPYCKVDQTEVSAGMGEDLILGF